MGSNAEILMRDEAGLELKREWRIAFDCDHPFETQCKLGAAKPCAIRNALKNRPPTRG